jgi:copper chaperone CopZ
MGIEARATPGGARIALGVSGMTCEGCAGAVRRVLTRVPGVSKAEIDLAGGRATVEGTAPVSDLVAAVEAAGYGARPL